MNTQHMQTHREEHFTLWFMGCILFTIAITFSLIYHLTIVPRIESMEMMIGLINPRLFVPIYLQVSFSLILAIGLGSIIGMSLWRKASFTLLFLGCVPMVLALLFYAIPQLIGDLSQQDITSWKINSIAFQILPFVPVILLFTSYAFFILSIIALLRTLWLKQYAGG